MHVTNYRFTLDVNDAASQAMLSVRKGDSARRLLITLAEGGKPYSIAEGCYAVLNAVRSDGAVYFGDCIISGNVISCELDKAIATAEGRIDCDVSLYDAEGELLTSPRFALFVYAGVTTGDEIEGTDEYRTLGEYVIAAEKTSAELMELKDTIAVETEKANAAISEFNGWYDDAKNEIAELTDDTRITCEKLTEDCEAAVTKAGEDCAELISETTEKCDTVIDNVNETCSELSAEIKTELAEFSSVGVNITLAADGWEDSTALSATRGMRVHSGVWGNWLTSANDYFTAEGEFEGTYTLTETDNEFEPGFVGGTHSSYVQPYEITDIKLWLLSDETKTNLLGGLDTFTVHSPAEKAALLADGKEVYIHVWKQSVNTNVVYVNTHVTVEPGEYGFSYKVRIPRHKIVQSVSIDGIRLTSSTAVAPASETAAKYINCGVRAVSQGAGELIFGADELPDCDLSAGVTAVSGQGGAILNCAPSYTEGGGTGVITGSYVGDGGGTAAISVDDISYDNNIYEYVFAYKINNTEPRELLTFPFDINGIIILKEGSDFSVTLTKNYVLVNNDDVISSRRHPIASYYGYYLNEETGEYELGGQIYAEDLTNVNNTGLGYEQIKVDGNRIMLVDNYKLDGSEAASLVNYSNAYYVFAPLAGSIGSYNKADLVLSVSKPTGLNDAGAVYHYIAW